MDQTQTPQPTNDEPQTPQQSAVGQGPDPTGDNFQDDLLTATHRVLGEQNVSQLPETLSSRPAKMQRFRSRPGKFSFDH